MIVDVHTHTPTHRDAVPPDQRQLNAQWRPDRMVDAAVSWADYMAAMQAVDRACVFGIRFKNGHMPAGAEGCGRAVAGRCQCRYCGVRARPSGEADRFHVGPSGGRRRGGRDRALRDGSRPQGHQARTELPGLRSARPRGSAGL